MQIAGLISLWMAAAYSAITVIASIAWHRPRQPPGALPPPPVTILKPLCGWEPGLYEHLRSFCQQQYPCFELIFGVRDHIDPACLVVRRLAREFPLLTIKLVVNPQLHGSNCKISNLINMMPAVAHHLLVMADSDAFVGPDYLAAVTAPLADPAIGLVTCIYRGAPTRGLWSRLGAMYINEWYVPSVLLAWLFGHQGYVSGQTTCIRRDTLQIVGGFEPLANHLADDYRLGELVRAHGLRIELSQYVVRAGHHEPSLSALIRHETRWMRTLYILQPASFRGLFLTFSLPLALAGLLVSSLYPAGVSIAGMLFEFTLVARLVSHMAYRFGDGHPRWFADLWLVPLRDVLLCWVWLRTFSSSRLSWRGNEFIVDHDGVMRRTG